MKKFSVIAAIIMSLSGMAHADSKNWTGFYGGVDAEFVFNDVHLTAQQLGFASPSGTYNTHSDFSTFSPGIQLGYMHQFSHSMVSGIETNIAFNTTQKNTMNFDSEFNSTVYDRFIFQNEMQTSIKGRLGLARVWKKNIFLPYLTTGASIANIELTYQNEGNDYYSNTTTDVGWLIGAGIEWAFRQRWSLRAEYDFVDYGKATTLAIPTVYGLYDPNGHANTSLNSNDIVIAMNYWIL